MFYPTREQMQSFFNPIRTMMMLEGSGDILESTRCVHIRKDKDLFYAIFNDKMLKLDKAIVLFDNHHGLEFRVEHLSDATGIGYVIEKETSLMDEL